MTGRLRSRIQRKCPEILFPDDLRFRDSALGHQLIKAFRSVLGSDSSFLRRIADGRSATPLLGTIAWILLADRAYKADRLSDAVAARGGWANIKPMPTRKRVPSFSPFLYWYRNLAELFFNKIKHYRAIATRCEKHADKYLALVRLATIQMWLRSHESMT